MSENTNTNPQLLSNSRFSREQEARDRDAAMRSLDDTTLRPALRYVDSDDTAARAYPGARQQQYTPTPSPYPTQRQPRRRRGVGIAAFLAIGLALGALTAIVVHATSPRTSNVGIFGIQSPVTSEQTEATTTNEPQVTPAESAAETPIVEDAAPAQEPFAPEATSPESSVPEATTPEPSEEVSEPETYTITWTEDSRDGRGREEHSLTYTYDNGTYTIDYDGYTLTVTEEELEWLLGEGWDQGYGQDTVWPDDGGFDPYEGFGFDAGPGYGPRW